MQTDRYLLRITQNGLSMVGCSLILLHVVRSFFQKRKIRRLSIQQNDSEECDSFVLRVDPLFEKLPLDFLTCLALSDMISMIGWILPVSEQLVNYSK